MFLTFLLFPVDDGAEIGLLSNSLSVIPSLGDFLLWVVCPITKVAGTSLI